MGVVLIAVGTLIILLVVADVLWTTLWAERGAGPLTARVTFWLRTALRSVASRNSHRFLALSGPLLVASTVLTWIILMWIGWIAIFSAVDTPIVSTSDQSAPTMIDRIYFTGYSLFTLGNGDFKPQGSGWQIATVLATASGMFLVTTAVSFFLSVLPAVANKRALAGQVSAIAQRSDQFVVREWDGQGFSMLGIHLNSIVAELGNVVQQHKAYPVLHSYHSNEPQHANALAMAVLDDALTILEHGVRPDFRPVDAVLHPVRTTVTNYLETLEPGSIGPADAPPPHPSLSALRDAGIPVVEQRDFDAAVENFASRRRQLLGMVQEEAYSWPSTPDMSEHADT